MRAVFRGLAVAAGLVLAMATASEASTLALDVTSDTVAFGVGSLQNVGWQFTVNSTITVDGLGLFDEGRPGLAQSHPVGLWDNSGNLLASATVTNGSALVASASTDGDWLFETIAPIVLAPGSYVIGAFYSNFSTDGVLAFAAIATNPAITFVVSRASEGNAFAEPGVFGNHDPGVFGPTLRIADAPAAVPEPASLLLLGTGLATLAARRRKTT